MDSRPAYLMDEPVDPVAFLRERLVEMRDALIRQMIKIGVEGGNLALLASVGGAIAALDQMTMEGLRQ